MVVVHICRLSNHPYLNITGGLDSVHFVKGNPASLASIGVVPHNNKYILISGNARNH